jgi:acetyl-CoA acetyltransferase
MLQKQIGQTGIPVYNVSNACATGATALRTAIMAIKAG